MQVVIEKVGWKLTDQGLVIIDYLIIASKANWFLAGRAFSIHVIGRRGLRRARV